MWPELNRLSGATLGAWFDLLAGLSPGWQLAVTAVPLTAFALLVFRYASNQTGIRAAKDRVKAYLLEAWLFRDDLPVTLAANGRVLLSALRYFGHSLLPLAVMALPMALLLVQVEAHFAWRGLLPGESAVLAVHLVPGSVVGDPRLELPPGLVQETPVLRVAARGPAGPQALWRLGAAAPGIHEAQIGLGGTWLTRRVVVDAGAAAAAPLPGDHGSRGGRRSYSHHHQTPALAPVVYRADDWRSLGSPAEPALDPAGPVIAVELDYPRARGEFAGLSSASWLLVGMTLVLGFLMRRFFGVTF